MAVEQFEKSNGEGQPLFVLKSTSIPAELFGSGLVAADPPFRIQKLSMWLLAV
jgi:hypothetical protein